MTQNYHLAQINIARGLATLDSPVMKGFVDQLDPINSLAEASQGFVWRLQDGDDDATTPNAFDDELIIVNMSVWSSFASLKNYVYSGDHLTILKQKKTWFQKIRRPALALWWIPEGAIPTIQEGKEALECLRLHGSTPRAFTFSQPQPTPAERCA